MSALAVIMMTGRLGRASISRPSAPSPPMSGMATSGSTTSRPTESSMARPSLPPPIARSALAGEEVGRGHAPLVVVTHDENPPYDHPRLRREYRRERVL